MKIIIKFFAIYLAALLCFSCNDLLVEKPQAIAVETFYNTVGEIEAGVFGVYQPIRNFGEYLAMIEVSSDIHTGGWGTFLVHGIFQGLDDINIVRAQNRWGQFYLAIRNANIMIQAIPNASSLSDNEKDIYLAEVMFLRALTYFHLVRVWGDIPLRTEENMNELSLPRSPTTEVYNLIISDLEFAERLLPSTVSIVGRPTRWSAKTLLADVYFYQNQFDKALEKANEVIQSRQYSLVEVETTDDFEKLYGATVVTTPEEIFYFKYHEQDGFGLPTYMHGIGGEYINREGYYCCTMNNESFPPYINWDDKDLRKALFYPYSGYDPGTLLYKKYIDHGTTASRNSYPQYRYADCLLIYAEASCQVSGGPTAEGIEFLNMVHRRAYGYPSTQPSAVDFKLSDYNKDSFIELCIYERGWETMGEAKRFFELKRLGKTVAERYVRENRGLEIAEKHWLWPIPNSELNYNDAITYQNPGY